MNPPKALASFWICCAIYGGTLAQDPHAKSDFRFRHYNKDDGLDNRYTTRIITDSLGYVWCHSTEGGLVRFDGYNFKGFEYDEHDPNRNALSLPIDDILTDATGNIWLRQRLNPDKPQFILTKYDWKLDKFKQYEINVKGFGYLRFEKDNSTIWASSGFGNGLFRYNFQTAEVKEFVNPYGDSTQSKLNNAIRAIKNYDTHLLLSTAYGLWIFDKASQKFSRPPCNPNDSVLLYQSPMGWFMPLESSKVTDSIWVRTGSSIIKFDSTFSIVQRAEKMPLGIASLDSDHDGIWFRFAREDGLFYYNLELDSVINVRAKPGKFSLPSNHVGEISVDRGNSVWIATQQGISRLMRSRINYRNVNLPELRSSILYEVDEKEYLVWNQHEKVYSVQLGSSLDIKKGIKETALPIKDAIVARFWKGEKYLWASIVSRVPTGAAGVLGFPINPKTNLIEDGPLVHLEEEPGNVNAIAKRFCHDVLENGDGNLWVAHATGALSRVDLNIPYGSQGSVTRYTHIEGDTNSIVSSVVLSLFPEDKHSIWALTVEGVDLLHFDESKHVTFEHVFAKRELPEVLFRSEDGNLFLGTINGLYQANKGSGRYRFNYIPSLGRRAFNSIQEDQLGRLWLKANKTLICFDPKSGIVIEFDERDGIDHLLPFDLARHQTHDTMHRTKDGWMVVTDPDGATFFDPMSFKVDTRVVVPILTTLLVNNQPSNVGDNSVGSAQYVIPYQIGALNELVLDYQHNNFAVEFSAMEMIAPEKNRYRHKLENFDKNWIETDFKNRSATYTNLDPGRYTFKVRASNHHGVWSAKETKLTVVILAPPWRTWWAYGSYCTAFIGLLVLWRNYDRKRLKLKHRAEHLTELDHLKSQFFANISHEFRTPITLILGPLKEMSNGTFTGDQKPVVAAMMRNGQRLLRLINQLLDLSKIESGKMELHFSTIDLVQFLREISSSYESLATNKKIKYLFYPEVQELIVFVDRDKIEKVIHNLLSNAFKFTKEGGEIIVNLKTEAKQAVILVKDSGIGIPADQLDKVFDRFYQVDSSQTREYEGSGIGMALAKELIELHHGSITIESEEGRGTTFTISIPLRLENVRQALSTASKEAKTTIVPEYIAEEEVVQIHKSEVFASDQLPLLLIVEDNTDMRHYIKKTLSDRYQIIEAENGKEGVTKAEQTVPDLIISDIMMPQMDGYKLCERIKTKELTSHIPVILLTAKADHDSKLSGLEIGADDYLSKPFDAGELKLIVRNRIEQRRKMRERFSKEITLEPKHISVSSLDEKFLAKVMAIIEEHIDDENFSIDSFSGEAGYSNIHFYRKIKALTGQTPSTFLRTIRLKRAAEMLSVKSDNVTQIAYSVGFSSLSYFNKCFKEQFGMTPGQFADKAK